VPDFELSIHECMKACRITLLTVASMIVLARGEEPAPVPPKVALEALQRLKGVDLESNPALKAAVAKVVASTRGTPDFIQVARILELPEASGEVLAIALKLGAEDARAVDGLRWILGRGELELARGRLEGGTADEVPVLIDLLGNAGDAPAIGLLVPLLAEPGRAADLRQRAVRALARSEPGARALLDAAAAGKLPEDLAAAAATTLRVVAWPAIQADAAKQFPAAAGLDGSALPTLAELLAMTGDAARGAEVVALPQTACLLCHKVGERGVDFGPALTEIGNKLSREGLFEAILDPAASISHGFKGMQVTLKAGGARTGFVVSETDKEIGLKEPSGIVTRILLAEIEKREELPGSMMPAGLDRAMSAAQLADLVAYLASLKP
jgi:putative heme-binding domain-containing protein